jgi:hypothetical protein
MAAVASAVLIAVLVTGATASAVTPFRASIQNSVNKAGSGALGYTHSYGSTCTSVLATGTPISATNTSTFACSGALLPATSTGSRTDTVTNNGSVAADSIISTVTIATCAPVELVNSRTATDPMLVRGAGLTYGNAGPLTGSLAWGVSAANQNYAAEVTQSAWAASQAFTMAIWFKTSTPNAPLMGWDASPINNDAQHDKMLWLDSAGHVVFGNYNGTTSELTSAGSSYADGNWHVAIATTSPTAGVGSKLYVDATSVTNTAVVSSEASTGSWHLGWNDANIGWPDSPTALYFTGALANASTALTAFTTAQVTALRTAATQTAWNNALVADSAKNSWVLNDTGLTTYTGNIAPIGATNPCSMIAVNFGTGAVALSALATPSATTVVAAGTTASGSVALSHLADYDANILGLNILAPLTNKLAVGGGAWSTSFNWVAQNSLFVV